MAISTTTFAERLSTINAGKSTSWTVPGGGLASVRDERSFLSKARRKLVKRSTHTRRNPVLYILAAVTGAGIVIASRWLDYTYLDSLAGFASSYGVDIAVITQTVPASMMFVVLLSLVAMLVLRLRSKATLGLQAAGILAAMILEPELVAMAPEVYANFYPPDWINSMVAKASLLA